MSQRYNENRDRSSVAADAWAIMKRSLMHRRRELLERVRAVEKDLGRESDPASPDWSERAIQQSNDEVLSEIGHVGARELEAIDLALRRIASGTYGMCRDCGGAIATARLRALPHVDRCENCAE